MSDILSLIFLLTPVVWLNLLDDVNPDPIDVLEWFLVTLNGLLYFSFTSPFLFSWNLTASSTYWNSMGISLWPSISSSISNTLGSKYFICYSCISSSSAMTLSFYVALLGLLSPSLISSSCSAFTLSLRYFLLTETMRSISI